MFATRAVRASLDHNFFTIPDEAIGNIKVSQTVVVGKIVHQAQTLR